MKKYTCHAHLCNKQKSKSCYLLYFCRSINCLYFERISWDCAKDKGGGLAGMTDLINHRHAIQTSKFWEELRAYFRLLQHGPYRKQKIGWVYRHTDSKVYPKASFLFLFNQGDTHAHTAKWSHNPCILSKIRRYIYTQTAGDFISLLLFFKSLENRLIITMSQVFG